MFASWLSVRASRGYGVGTLLRGPLLVLIFLFVAHQPAAVGAVAFIRGDADANGKHELTDAVRIGIFLGEPLPCHKAADVDDHGSPELTGGVFLLICLFRSGTAPPPRYPLCGPDPTADGLDCESFPACTCGGKECAPGEYCAEEEGNCGGEGECSTRPQICPDVFDPVCGCDGNTYRNACEAARAGVSVEHRGACRPPPCTSNAECAAGEYCAKEEGNCGGEGECSTRPQICPDVFDPVCGCDGNTYGNACEAARAGVNVEHRGACR